MNAERWQKVKNLFDAVVELAPANRKKFLDEACGADERLRRDVENLLDSFNEAESFLEKPAATEVASQIIELKNFEPGKRFAHYEIIRQIGAGGMGEVYLARDTKLERPVAVKILNQRFSRHESNLYRFVQEAKAASALNHPNILIIHEIGESENANFIVSEFIEGKTLREFIEKSTLKLSEILEISIQIAAALAAAHAARIVHRDIKPENVIVRPDGFVKILDFGLAKLIEQKAAGFDEKTVRQNETAKGVILGTVSYMSPEQAKGEPVDTRTDIFSLGVVIYEMIAGRTPFAGNSMSETFANLINAEPLPLARFNANVPDELQRIVRKMLHKKKDERYQTMKDFLSDLKVLQKRLEFEVEFEKISATTFGDGKNRNVETQIFANEATIEATVLSKEIFDKKSIAVLPFSTLNLKQDDEYLGIGLADALITQLSRTKQLAVRPTSAVREFVNSGKSSTEIGNLLDVGSILEGSIQRSGEQMRVTVQLVDTKSKNSLWARRFDVKFTDIFAVEEEITTQVTDALLLNLNSDEIRRIDDRGTTNAEAYQAYLQGRYFWNKFIPEDLPKAIEAFERAVSFDPNFAGAYSGIARAYRYILGLRSIVETQKAKEKMLRAAANALALDGSLAEAHLAIAEIKLDEWDWKFAEREYQRAIELNPNSAEAYAGYANFLSITERFDRAFVQIDRALELDPLSTRLRNGKGKILVIARRYDEAVRLFERAIKIEPKDALAHYFLGYAFACQEMFAEAIFQYRTAIEISESTPEIFLGYAYARAGERKSALEILERVKDRKDISQAELAVIYVGLGDKDAAFATLEKGFEAHDLQMQYLKVEQHYDALRDDMRFQDLLRRMNFENFGTSPAVENRFDKPKPARDEKQNEKSIAVLPFANMSADAENDYFCDGLAEELLNALSKIKDLKVAARTSAFSFKNKNVAVGEIGNALNVKTILEGSVRRSGNRLRISVQLVNASNGFHIWSQRYDGEMRDIFDLQDEITLAVIDELKVKFLSEEKEAVLKRYTADAKAYEFYLKGMYYRWKLAPEEFRKCGAYFRRAVEIDPNFALGYFGLNSYYGYGTAWGILPMPPQEGWAKAEAAIEKGLEIDPTLPQLRLSQAALKLVYYRRWNEAGKEIESAAEANPKFPEIHYVYSSYLLMVGQFDEAIGEARKALELDPISVNYSRSLGVCFFFARRYDAAIRQLNLTLELEPHNASVHEILGGVFAQKGMPAEAVAAFQRAATLEGDDELAAVFSRHKDNFAEAAQSAARKRIERLNAKAASGEFVLAINFARAYLTLGDVEQAFEWLEKAVEERNVFPLLMNCDPFYDPVRADSRFQNLLRRMNL